MKRRLILETALAFFILSALVIGCKKEDSGPELKGSAGNPRFNLQFTNEQNVDMDLHVLTPNNFELYFANSQGDNGVLDIDCLCGVCANGPNENIYWSPGTAPHGEYKFWVEYYDDCGTSGSASTYTLRLMRNSDVLETYTGTLTSQGSKSQIYTFTY